MARFVKTRSAKPLAQGILGRSWSKDYGSGIETFSLHIMAEDTPGGDARFVSLKFDRNEAFEIVKYLAPFLAEAKPADIWNMRERKDAAAALRELADFMEGIAK